MAGKKPRPGQIIARLDGGWDEIIENHPDLEPSTVDISVEDLILTQQDLESVLSDDFESVELMPVVSVDPRGEVDVQYLPLAPGREGRDG